MKRRTKKLLIALSTITILGGALAVKIIKHTNRLTSIKVDHVLKTIDDNEVAFEVDGFNDYVNIALKNMDSKTENKDIKIKIVDSEDLIVDEFSLEKDEVLKESYDAKKGKWKLIVDFEDKEDTAMIGFAYSINSTKDNLAKFD